MSLLLRTTALMLLLLSRAPAMAAVPLTTNSTEDNREESQQNEVSSKLFRHSLSGLYGIANQITLLSSLIKILMFCTAKHIKRKSS